MPGLGLSSRGTARNRKHLERAETSRPRVPVEATPRRIRKELRVSRLPMHVRYFDLWAYVGSKSSLRTPISCRGSSDYRPGPIVCEADEL